MHTRPSPYSQTLAHPQLASSAAHTRVGGELGAFSPGDMQKAFEEVAFGLEVGEISGVVDSESGVHLVYRTA